MAYLPLAKNNDQPVNLNDQPVNLNDQPVNLNDQPVNLNDQPVNLNDHPLVTKLRWSYITQDPTDRTKL